MEKPADLPLGTDLYDPQPYQSQRKPYKYVSDGYMKQDTNRLITFIKQVMDGRAQIGLVALLP